jgi:hypothetical protein
MSWYGPWFSVGSCIVDTKWRLLGQPQTDALNALSYVFVSQSSCGGGKVTSDAILKAYNFQKNRINIDARVQDLQNLIGFMDKNCEINSVKEGFRASIKDLNQDLLKNKDNFSLHFLNEKFERKPNFFG